MQRQSLLWRAERRPIAFVPTMGALHEGHAELIRVARKHVGARGRVIVSIYVNPAQFSPNEDLARYPRPRHADTALCRKLGVDILFAPANLYLPGHSTWVDETEIAQGRCGGDRPGHFRGVATIVSKLFWITLPDVACFGWKDAQQLSVITRMVRDLNIPVQIIPVETVRDRDGLALSSRNRYLTPAERERALALPILLRVAVTQPRPEAWLKKHLPRVPGLQVDYVTWAENRLCAAVRVGKTRLLDTMACPKK